MIGSEWWKDLEEVFDLFPFADGTNGASAAVLY
jgi:hypothetical protein